MKKCLGYKIRKVRELKNISQYYVASQLGISQAAYSGIESGKTKINNEKLLKISNTLNVDSDAIINFDTEIALKACMKISGMSFLEKTQPSSEIINTN